MHVASTNCAFYLTRYPIGRDEENTEWADMIDVTPEDDTGNGTADDTGNGTGK